MLVNKSKMILAAFAAATALMASQGYATPVTGAAANGLLLSLGADSGITTTGGVVTGWTDETTSNQVVSSTVGAPIVNSSFSTATKTGLKSVTFDGSSGLALNDGAALAVQNVSTFVVVKLGTDQASRIFVADIGSNGWASGINDTANDNVKWYRGHAGGQENGTTSAGNVASGTSYIVSTSTNVAAGNSQVHVSANGSTFTTDSTATDGLGTPTPTGVNYGSTATSLGYLIPGIPNSPQFLIGDIAEVLVYDNSAPGYSEAAVDSYLNQKYFSTPEPGSLGLIGLAGLGLLRRRRAHR